ncbi:MAG: hypothetical protein QOI66_4502 [Myxococcales bacterium]|nr:hypothetical protein [Myxococcales bacterium]
MSKATSSRAARLCRPLLALGVLGASSCSADAVPVDDNQQARAIIDGTEDSGDPSIVLFYAQTSATGGALCTATVISPRTLILAAHCVSGADVANAKFAIAIANNLAQVMWGQVKLMPVMTTVFDPQFAGPAAPAAGHDFAVAAMSAPLTLKPIPLNRTPTVVGEPVRQVGYGLSSLKDEQAIDLGMMPTMLSAGTKRETTAALGDLYPGSELVTTVTNLPHSACRGDSGSPLLIKRNGIEVISGIASFTVPGCQAPVGYGLVDKEYDWIAAQVKKYDPDYDLASGAGGSDGGSANPADGNVPPPPPDALTVVAEAGAPDALPPNGGISPSGGEGGCSYSGRSNADLVCLASTLSLMVLVARRRRHP